jgi:hypothetical protein
MEGVTAKAGDIFTMEGGLGRTFAIKSGGGQSHLSLGPIYYVQYKMTDDRMVLDPVTFGGQRDHIYAIGGEVALVMPNALTSLTVRCLGELEAHNRFEGSTLLITFGQSLMTFSKKN